MLLIPGVKKCFQVSHQLQPQEMAQKPPHFIWDDLNLMRMTDFNGKERFQEMKRDLGQEAGLMEEKAWNRTSHS